MEGGSKATPTTGRYTIWCPPQFICVDTPAEPPVRNLYAAREGLNIFRIVFRILDRFFQTILRIDKAIRGQFRSAAVPP